MPQNYITCIAGILYWREILGWNESEVGISGRGMTTMKNSTKVKEEHTHLREITVVKVG